MTTGQTERPAETDLVRIFPVAVGACYVAGLLIVNIELARHGVWEFDLGQPQYVLVGALWLALAGLGIAWLIFALMIPGKIGFGSLPPRPFKIRKALSLPFVF